MTLVSARVISTRKGHFLNARVNSTAKFAKLRITLVNKNGQASRLASEGEARTTWFVSPT